MYPLSSKYSIYKIYKSLLKLIAAALFCFFFSYFFRFLLFLVYLTILLSNRFHVIIYFIRYLSCIFIDIKYAIITSRNALFIITKNQTFIFIQTNNHIFNITNESGILINSLWQLWNRAYLAICIIGHFVFTVHPV